MKEKNHNYSKNVTFNTFFFKPEGQITKQDDDLLTSCRKIDFNSLTQLLNKVEFKTPILNCALANLVVNYKNIDTFDPCLKLLFSKNINLSYKYVQEFNKSIFMLVIKKSDFNLLKKFLECVNSRINAIKILPLDKMEEYQISEIKKIFCQKDYFGNNFSHIFETYDKVELNKIFYFLYDKFPFMGNRISQITKIQEVFKNLFLEKNNEGDTIMSLSLERKLIQIIFKLLLINGYKPNINIKNNNLVHCAVNSKNISCVKIILYYCSEEELNKKNNDSLTPSQLANKLGLLTISTIINEYQNNYKEEGYKEHFYKNYETYFNKINNSRDNYLINIMENKYREVLFELKEFKLIYEMSNDNGINQTNKNNSIINEDNLLYKLSLYKIEWNIIKCKIRLYSFNKENNEKNSLITLYKSIEEFFNNNFSNEFILYLISYTNDINQTSKDDNANDIKENLGSFNNIKPFEILIYNKIIFYFKIGDFKSLIETAQIYFTKKFSIENKLGDNNITNKKLFVLFLNISCILIEAFIFKGYKNFSQLIINTINKYSFIIKEPISSLDFSEETTIFKYLTKKGVLNQYSAYFSEIYCYINFLKIINNKEKNKNKDYFVHNKKLLEDSKFSIDSTIFDRLNILYTFVELKNIYEKKDNEIYNKIIDMNYCYENSVYYFNTLGIFFLKKQKYNLGKFFFAKGYHNYMQAIKSNRDKSDKFYNFRIDIITALLYNISLCYYYLKQYQICITILECILNFKINKDNYFFHYRLGLCYYHLYIDTYNKNSDCFNKNIIKLIGYEKIKNYKKNDNIKQLSIELDDEGIISNLSQKFEAEHKKKKTKEKRENKFSFYSNDKFEKNEKYQQKYNNIYKSGKVLGGINNTSNYSIKKIILKNASKTTNNTTTNRSFLNNKKIMNNDSNKSDYINKAIKYFKKVIFISKLNKVNTYSDSMKSLYEFYSNFDGDDDNNDNSEKSGNLEERKIPQELLINSYFHLLICLSIKKNWLEMILIIKDYENYDNRDITTNKLIKLKIWLYELEAYINLKNNKKINEIINKIKKFKKLDLSVLNKTNNDIINEINIKLYIYYTLTKIYIAEKNYKDADTNIAKILMLMKEEKNIPYYIIDLLLNVYIIKLNSEPNINEKTKYRYNNIILKLIKNKKVNEA